MLTRFIRIQLVIFAIGSLVGMAVMASVYMQVPTLLGWGRITVTVELPGTGGLYRFSNVTYRGVQVGKVTDVDLIPHGASATLSLKTSPKIPAKLAAHVRSASAIGEQYLDLVPEDDDPPYLVDGSRIAMADTTVPQEVGPLLDQTSALIKSIPKERLSALLNESYLALGGAGDDLALLVDSAATISGAMSDTREQTVDLLQDSVPLLNAQEESRESLRVWSRSLADITGTMVASDGQWRTILRDGPGAANEASRLFNQLKPTLPLLLANLRTVGQILVTYRAGLEQILVLMPPFVANLLSAGPDHNPTGMGQGDFTSEVDTPTGMYCKLPQDSPLAVRGARNYPCAGKPGKRAPTAAICNSDDEYQPLVMRQHLLGPYPLDPNLMAQGVPPDSRVTGDDRIYGPTEGTPAPAEAAPSAFDGGGPDVVATPYDPGSGRFVAPNGQTYQQANAGEAGSPKSWQELVMTAGA
jgi:virulence factor Mce-like protein